MKGRNKAAVLLPVTALVLVGSFTIHYQAQQARKRSEAASLASKAAAESLAAAGNTAYSVGGIIENKAAPGSKSALKNAPVAAGKSAPIAGSVTGSVSGAGAGAGANLAPGAASSVAVAPSAAVPPSCWEARFDLEGSRLNAVQKESLGERAQKIRLADLISKFSSKMDRAQICVRSAGHALAFERDAKDKSVLIVRGGSGRIGLKSHLDVQVCTDIAKCAPCKIKKDSFEEAMLGGADADAQHNESEDVTNQLSPEVRRELARLESEAKPAAVDAWTVQEARPHCGRS